MDLDIGINRSCQRQICILNSSSNIHSFQADSHKLVTLIKFFQSSKEETDALANFALQSNICFKIMCVEEGREGGCFSADVSSLSLPEGWPDFPCPTERARGRTPLGICAQGLLTQAWRYSFQNSATTEEGASGSLLKSFQTCSKTHNIYHCFWD